jgi:hypothetical protein
MLSIIKNLRSLTVAAGLLAVVSSVSIAQGVPERRPDLMARLTGPRVAAAGQDISRLVQLWAGNRGTAVAPGTRGAIDPANGYMIDLVLTTDPQVPEGFANYSPNWVEDVLLRGGRVSNTVDLHPGALRRYNVGAVIPADTPPGRYLLCARIDAGNRVAESNEHNNAAFWPIQIVARR